MAGGKETPRQKLIGMMYLVLLALLALQVGAEIMVKFAQLNDSLSLFVKDSNDKSKSLLETITKKVAERGNKPEEKKALEQALKLHEESQRIIDEIEATKNEIITKTGGYNVPGNPKSGYLGMKDADVTSAILLGAADKKDGYAYKLKPTLDKYIDFVNGVYVHVENVVSGTPMDKIEKNHFPKMAHDGKDDPLLKDFEGNKTKDFAVLNFDHTPMIASLAFLTEKQSKIAAYEAEILAKLKQSVGASDFKFDEVFAMALPESKVVAAGTQYEAKMFITAASSAIKPKMKFGKNDIAVDEAGRGTVKFRASGGSYDKEGRVEKSWKGQITIKKPTGAGDTTFLLTERYTVTKPVIQVQSGSVSALYRNCGNDLKVLVPALGADYKPSFTLSGGGSAIKGAKTGDVKIVPTPSKKAKNPKVKLSVKSGGNLIGVETFAVKPIPKPELIILAGKKPVKASQFKNGMSCPRSLAIQVKPDQTFADFLPKDAKYYVEDYEVLLAAGKRPMGKKSIKGAGKKNLSKTAKIADLASKSKEGMRLIIEVKKVTRKNYKGQKETVNLGGPQIFVVPLN